MPSTERLSEETVSLNYQPEERTWHSTAFLLICTLVIFISSILISGYKVYYHNQALQLPLVYQLNDPDLFPHDPFASTLPYYSSMLWRVVALLARVIPLEPLLFALFLLERLLLMYSAGALARAFVPKSVGAAVGAMAFFAFMPQPIIGGGTLVMEYFEQTGLTIAFLLLAMGAFHRGRQLSWAVLMAVAFNCNSMYGIYTLSYFGAMFILDRGYQEQWRRWGRALVVLVVLSTPALISGISATSVKAVNNKLWLQASRIRVPHHLWPDTWPVSHFITFCLFTLLVVIMLALRRRFHERLFKHTCIWAGVSILWVTCSIVAAWVRIPLLLVLQPARATDLWCCFGAVAAISTAAAWVPRGNRRTALVLTCLVGLAGLVSHHQRMITNEPLYVRPRPSTMQVAEFISHHTPRGSVFLVNPNWGTFRAIAHKPAFVTWKDGAAILWYRPYASEWMERVKALDCDTEKDSPPGDGMKVILDELYAKITDKRALELSRQYGIDYWIVKVDHHSSLPVVYENRYYRVLDLR